MDVTRSHAVFLCGKRGSGKSFTLAVIAEGMAALDAEIRKNVGVIIMDTMGIFWTMKYPNERMRELLEQWGMTPEALEVDVYAPYGAVESLRENGIAIDKGFAINPSELEPSQWLSVFGLEGSSSVGALIEETVAHLQETKKDFSLEDVQESIKKSDAEETDKRAANNLMSSAERWGLFRAEATPISELVQPGKITILDVSMYAAQASAWNTRALVIGLVAGQLFNHRMAARKIEEHKALEAELSYHGDQKNNEPVIWMLIDEAHEFLPNKGETPATDALVTILREGRQPGLSLILATQQPGKIHTDVMTQSDIIISHRITARVDTDALGMLTQSYMQAGLGDLLRDLPRTKGAAIVLDDTNEKMYSLQVRPRVSWHGGDDPDALRGVEK